MVKRVAICSESAAKYRLQVDKPIQVGTGGPTAPDRKYAMGIRRYYDLGNNSHRYIVTTAGSGDNDALVWYQLRRPRRARWSADILAQPAANAYLNTCRLLHGSACVPARERAPDRS